ncbi:MAG TPA: tryptophan 2,3-dioxygenase family protein [Brumimicrobium sp.]|nr:tryptophan 2,3-dioxygenase family protein [Brumimicrobium sp.]
MAEDNNELLKQIEQKYRDLGENPTTYLEGLLQSKPINYWDYIQPDALLSLQKTRTDYKDEKIFIMYHQVTELVTGMMIHELEQLVEENLPESQWIEKMTRLNRYTRMLIDSFDVMKYGMDYDDYNTFRKTLAPASGFQSVSYRYIEIYATRSQNLINAKGRERMKEIENPTVEDYYEHIYWKDVGYNRMAGKQSLTLRLFCEKYEKDLISMAKAVKGKTLEEQFNKMSNPSQELTDLMKEFDRLYNVDWPIVHLETAQHYLDMKGENKAATGGSEWKKYLHPKYQQRKFFPSLWDQSVLDDLEGL